MSDGGSALAQDCELSSTFIYLGSCATKFTIWDLMLLCHCPEHPLVIASSQGPAQKIRKTIAYFLGCMGPGDEAPPVQDPGEKATSVHCYHVSTSSVMTI